MKLRHLLATAVVIGAGIGAPLRAQAPGDLNSVSHDSSKTVKQADHARKKAHHNLTKARKTTKTGLKRAAHLTTKTHSAKHKSRSANKLAHKVSQAGKALKQTSSKADAALTKADKDNKQAIKKP